MSHHKPLVTEFKFIINQKFSLKRDAVRSLYSYAKEIYYENPRNNLKCVKCFDCGVSGLCSDNNHRALVDEHCNCIVDVLNKSAGWKCKKIGNNGNHRNFHWSTELTKMKGEQNFLKNWGLNGDQIPSMKVL